MNQLLQQFLRSSIAMGNQCLASTPNENYASYFQSVKIPELKDLWETVKLYKIKKIYDESASTHPEYENHTYLPYQHFKRIFPEFARYDQVQIKRLFEIFDIENQGFVDWNGFFATISICYFAPEQILSLLMFMIFDTSLTKELTKVQVVLMVEKNLYYIRENEACQDHSPLYEQEEIIDELLKKGSTLTVNQWLKISGNYFDFSKFRRFFNIFAEQKMEKQLAKNFNQWNTIYDEEKQKFISYLVSFKWFESWRIYIQEQYNQSINIYSNGKQAVRTIKTIKKTFKKKSLGKNLKKIGESSLAALGYREIKVNYQKPKLEQQEVSTDQIKNIDFVHSNIGQRPRQITNNFLEGEFQQVLRPQLSENMDYVLVSETVWKNLKSIYDGFPEFRRTGFDVIELYPKIIKIYSAFFKSQIDYSSEVIREVSAYLRVDHLLINSIQIPEDILKDKIVFFKTIGMAKWEQVEDLTFLFTELSPEIIIFMIYIDKKDGQSFRKNHLKNPKDVTEVNVGDFLTYTDPKTKIQKSVVFMGKSTEGKYIIHFHKEPYFYDICLMENQLIKNCKLVPKLATLIIEHDKKTHTELIGLPNTKGTGFINSVITHLFENKYFKSQLSLVDSQKNQCIIHILSQIQILLNQKKRVESRDILDMIEVFLPNYQNFEVTMCAAFLDDFFSIISQELGTCQMKDFIKDQFSVRKKKKTKCLKCKVKNQVEQVKYLLRVPIPETKELYYEVIFVPSANGPRGGEIKKYGFKLQIGATFKKFKQQFQKQAGIDSETYLLAQVYANNIVKNYNSVGGDATLEQIKLRETDIIFAYELVVDFEKFVAGHYSTKQKLSQSDLKVDQFIDCKHSQKGWIFGKVAQIQYLPYTQNTVVKVQHKFTKNESWQISYDVFDGCVAKFPLKSFRNAEQFHLRLQQRCFNQASNEMQLCAMPIVVVLTNWMRWREFYFLIYQQMKRFIADQYVFNSTEDEQCLQPTNTKLKTVNMKDKKMTRKNMEQQKLDKFKQYKNSPLFPYTLHLADYEGRCAMCFKFLKSVVFKGENQLYCEGCTLSQSEPISWQVKPADLMVCVDWKDLSRFKKDPIKDHSSIANINMSKKNDKESLDNCLKQMGDTSVISSQSLCCNETCQKQINETLLGTSEIVPIYLQRIVEEPDGFKKIIHKHIEFRISDLKIMNSSYSLIGVTSIEGNHRNIKYKSYVGRQNGEWLQHDGELVRIVDKKVVQKSCALTLYYKRNGK